MPDGTVGLVRARNEQKADADDVIPCILEPELTEREFRRNWAKLIQKIYEVDPLVCPSCAGPMRVIAFIEDDEAIRQIFRHMDLLETRRKPAHGPMFTRLRRASHALFVAEKVEGYHRAPEEDIVDPINIGIQPFMLHNLGEKSFQYKKRFLNDCDGINDTRTYGSSDWHSRILA